jgi:hypothetical protein
MGDGSVRSAEAYRATAPRQDHGDRREIFLRLIRNIDFRVMIEAGKGAVGQVAGGSA